MTKPARPHEEDGPVLGAGVCAGGRSKLARSSGLLSAGGFRAFVVGHVDDPRVA